MAAGLNVCRASHCTGFLRIGSRNDDAGLGEMTGLPAAGRVKGPITQSGKLCARAEHATAIRKRTATKRRKKHSAGAKARLLYATFTARLKSCPVTNPALVGVFTPPVKCPVTKLRPLLRIVTVRFTCRVEA